MPIPRKPNRLKATVSFRGVPEKSMAKRYPALKTPFLVIRSNIFWITGKFKRIENQGSFGKLFNEMDPVFELHFHALDGKTMVLLLRQLGEQFEAMKKKGIKGLYTDTPNQAIANYLIERFGGIETFLDQEEKRKAMKAYSSQKQYPRKYTRTPVRRIVIKF